MLTSLLALSLAAGATEVIAIDTPPELVQGARVVLTGALKGPTLDATAVYRRLFAYEGLLPLNDFDAFRAPPPPGWPASLNELWVKSLHHCQDIAGPIPWATTTMPGARCCSLRLGSFLWHRYLKEIGAHRALTVRAQGEGEGNCIVVATDFDPLTSIERKQQAQCEGSSMGEVTGTTIHALVDGQAGGSPHKVIETFAVAADKDPLAKSKPATGPVQLKAPCATLPAALVVSPPSVLAESVRERWAESVQGKGARLTCTLTQFPHVEPPEMEGLIPGMEVLSSVLTCGGKTVSAEVSTMAMGKKPPEALASERLIVNLAAALCR